MMILAFIMPPAALYACGKYWQALFILFLWLLSFPLMLLFGLGIIPYAFSVAIAVDAVKERVVSQQFDKVAGAINKATDRIAPSASNPAPPPPLPPPPQSHGFTSGHDPRVDSILGGSAPQWEAPKPGIFERFEKRLDDDPKFRENFTRLVRMIFLAVLGYGSYTAAKVFDIRLPSLPQIEWKTLLTRSPSGGDEKQPPVPVPTITVGAPEPTQEALGVEGLVSGVRIVGAGEVPATTRTGGPTASGNDAHNGLYYVCYLPDVGACDAAFKEEARLQSLARTREVPRIDVPAPTVTVPPDVVIGSPTPPAPPVERLWDHNGSLLKLEVNGTRRRFLFTQPREGLREEGVTEGMVAFDGIQNGDWLEGTAFVFSRRCGAVGFRVNGKAPADTKIITLRGLRPYVDGQCRLVNSEPGQLMYIHPSD